MSVAELFSEHPASVNQTYWEHLKDALHFSFSAGRISLLLLVHAILPFLFSHTGSRWLDELYQEMMAKKTLARQLVIEKEDSNNQLKVSEVNRFAVHNEPVASTPVKKSLNYQVKN